MNEYQKYQQYALDILDGTIPSCSSIKQACKRFLDLFDKYEFRPEMVEQVIDFIAHIKHYQGKSAGKPFILEPWQVWIISNIFGFYKDDGMRLIREAVIEVTRKNGKTALASAIALYCLLADGEAGAEVDFMANSVKQAHIAFDMSKYFSSHLDPKHKHIQVLRDSLKHAKSRSLMQVLATDKAGLDGYNSSLTILDECHAMDTSALYDVMKSSQGFREQPLTILITTAGDDTDLWYYQKRTTALDIVSGLKEDDGQFVCIYSLDKGDDIHNEDTWIKACPNLGITVTKSYLRDRVKEADNDVQAKKEVLVKQFNMWQEDGLDSWIPEVVIRDHSDNIEWSMYNEKVTWCGIDLSSVSDLTAATFLCKENNIYYFKTLYWLPEATLLDEQNGRRYRQWHDEGYLNITPGNVCDYDYILGCLLKRQEEGMILDAVSYDSYNATQFAINATSQGLPMKPYSQALANFNRPTKEFQRLLYQGRIVIDNNPITRWCFANATLKEDWNANVKPVKRAGQNKLSDKKIDGCITCVESLGGYLESNTAKFEMADFTV